MAAAMVGADMPPLTAQEAARVRQRIVHLFTKLHALTVPVDAVDFLLDVFRIVPPDQVDHTLGLVIASYEQQNVSGSLVDQAILRQVVQGMIRRQSGDSLAELRRHFEVINVFDVPAFKYVPERRTFAIAPGPPKLHTDADAKAEYLRERFELHKQRLMRHAIFAPPVSGATADTEQIKITPIQALVGERKGCVIFGYLTQRKEGVYVLEDPDGFVELDLREAHPAEGLYTEGCTVLVEGDFADGIFLARVLGLPPPESANETRQVIGHANLFGGRAQLDSLVALRDAEAEAEDAAMVVLSDVWLDQPRVLDALRILFKTLAGSRILGIVFMGSFASEPTSWTGQATQRTRDHFAALADVIAEFPELAKSCPFVFVPCAHDIGLADVLPRPPLPTSVLERLLAKVPQTVLASNPCRIRFCTKEIVLFREDLVNKLRRNCVVPPFDPTLTLPQQAIRTVIDGAHLSPLPLQVRPIYWSLDHTLRLFPLPNALILGDRCEAFEERRADCHCINPGPFGAPDYGFLMYYPAAERAELRSDESSLRRSVVAGRLIANL